MMVFECPFCSKPIEDVNQEFVFCCDNKTGWTKEKGWYISFEFIKFLSEKMLMSSPEERRKTIDFLTKTIPDAMKTLEVGLDRSVVKLYCSNPTCTEKGFISRSRQFAEKNPGECHTCHSPLSF